MKRVLLVVAAVLGAACGDDGGGGGGPMGSAVFRFTMPADPAAPVPLGDVPYPNGVHVGAGGRLQVTVDTVPSAPDADPAIKAALVEALGLRRGFGITTGALFPVDGVADGDAIDPATLVDHVTWVDLDDGVEIPIDTHVKADGTLFVAPKLGRVLVEEHAHAILLREGIATVGGRAFVAAPALQRLLAGDTGRGEDAYGPLRDYLDANAIDRTTLVGATSFSTEAPTRTLDRARALLDEEAPRVAVIDRIYRAGAELDGFLGVPVADRPGVDNEGGIIHGHIAALVLGHFTATDFTSREARAPGRWVIGDDGTPEVQGTEEIPFMLALPNGDLADRPVVVWNHGFGGSRAIVAYVSDTLAARGFVVIGIDIPMHGERFSAAQDARHNFTAEATPDGLADDSGQFSQLEYLDATGDEARGIPPLDPQAIVANWRQSVVDLMSEVRLISDGDWSALAEDFPGLSFRDDRIGYAGQSLGGLLGTMATTIDPKIGAAVLGVAGGGIIQHAVESSPFLWFTFGQIIAGALGTGDDVVMPGVAPAREDLGWLILQQLIEDCDPLAYAPHTIGRPFAQPKHVALLTAFSDEVLPNQSSEALAGAMGLTWMPTAASPDDARWVEDLAHGTSPLRANAGPSESPVTAGFVMLTPATHGMQTNQRDDSAYEPGFPPFVERASSLQIDNPIDEVQAMTADFLQTYVDNGSPTLRDPF